MTATRDYQLLQFSDYDEANQVAALLTQKSLNRYRVKPSDHGFMVEMAESAVTEKMPDTVPSLEATTPSRSEKCYRPSLLGFIADYLQLIIGGVLWLHPDWILSALTLDASLSRDSLIGINFFLSTLSWAGVILCLSGLRWLYVYFANSLIIEDAVVIHHQGIIARKQAQIRYPDIKTVEIRQTIIGRLLGIGEMRLDSSGRGEADTIIFKNLGNPFRVRQILNSMRTSTTGGTRDVA
jgi:hypothetical protein